MPHLKAIARDIQQNTQDAIGESPRSGEGQAESQWMVIDYVDVIVHIFHEDKRDIYRLEDLWSDAHQLDLDLPAREANTSA